jgi:hypothetical protein
MWIEINPRYPKLLFIPVPTNPGPRLPKPPGPVFLRVSAELARERRQNPQGNPKLGYYGISWEFMDVNGFCPVLYGKS